ncbi:MAG: hypothetical protein ABFS46_14035 [Myxococcota bacterium]
MSGWIGIREARERAGLRLVLLRGFPSPWSQAARAIFEIKRVPFLAVQTASDDPPGSLLEWTGQDGYPVAVYEAERPRAAWAYPWWAYIDGGDLRYASSSSTLLMMETLSVANGAVGATGLFLW